MTHVASLILLDPDLPDKHLNRVISISENSSSVAFASIGFEGRDFNNDVENLNFFCIQYSLFGGNTIKEIIYGYLSGLLRFFVIVLSSNLLILLNKSKVFHKLVGEYRPMARVVDSLLPKVML